VRERIQKPTIKNKQTERKNRDKPFQIIINIYMEMSQGNSLYSYLKQKHHYFFFYKPREQKSRKVPIWEVGSSGWWGRSM
jgi:hypothetical protein